MLLLGCRYLENGEMVTQVGHSKKVRGYMVMPVKLDTAGGAGAPVRHGGWF